MFITFRDLKTEYMITFMIKQLNNKDTAVCAVFRRETERHNEYTLANLCRLICLNLVNLFRIDFFFSSANTNSAQH